MSKQTVIITGVSSGLGRALFDVLRGTDVRLVCISRTFLEYQTALASRDVVLLACDLSKPEEVSTLVQKLNSKLSSASDAVFINNAATIVPIGPIGQIDDAAITATTHTNFISPMRITNTLCGLKKVKKLTVIHVSTGAARIPLVGWSLYCATKAACKMFFAVLEEQYKGSKKVVVNQFDPGVIDTPMQKKIRQSSNRDFPRVEEFKTLQKMQKLSDPALVAKRLIEQYIPI